MAKNVLILFNTFVLYLHGKHEILYDCAGSEWQYGITAKAVIADLERCGEHEKTCATDFDSDLTMEPNVRRQW